MRLGRAGHGKSWHVWVRSGVARQGMEFVYFIGDCQHRVKIGRTVRDPKHRLAQLQTGQADKLRILACDEVEDSTAEEAALHTQFEQSRISGEWFELTPELQTYIDIVSTRSQAHEALRRLRAHLGDDAVTLAASHVNGTPIAEDTVIEKLQAELPASTVEPNKAPWRNDVLNASIRTPCVVTHSDIKQPNRPNRLASFRKD